MKVLFAGLICLAGCRASVHTPLPGKNDSLKVSLVSSAIVDKDGNSYGSVVIGDQEWMTEDYKCTHFADGTAIPVSYHSSDTIHAYGPRYVWNDVVKAGFAPAGWHVPTDDEWSILNVHIANNGASIKEAGTAHWNTANGTNVTGFTAWGAGHIYGDALKSSTTWWTSTAASASDGFRWVLFDNKNFGKTNNDKSLSFNVRLIRDRDTTVLKPLFKDSLHTNGFALTSPVEGTVAMHDTLDYGGTSVGYPTWGIAQWNCLNNDLKNAVFSSSGSSRIYQYGDSGNRVVANVATGSVSFVLNSSTEYGLNGITSNPRLANQSWPHLLLYKDLPDSQLLNIADKKEVRMKAVYSIDKIVDKMPAGTTDASLHTAQFQWYITVQNRNVSSPDYGRYIWFGLCYYDYRYAYTPLYSAEDGGKEVNTGAFIYVPDMQPILQSQGTVSPGKVFNVDVNVLPLIQAAFQLAQQRNYLTSTTWKDLYISTNNIGWEVPGTYDVGSTIQQLNIWYR